MAGAILFGFVLLRVVPGDPAALLAGQSASAQVVSQLRIEMGLDKPWILQLFHYFGDVVVGNLGRSIISNRPVLEELIEAFGPTAELVLTALLIAVPIGIGLGVVAAVQRGTIIDRAIMALAVAGISLPVFWVGYMLILSFGVQWGLLPFTGRLGPIWTLEGLQGLALPALTAAFTLIGPIARISRTALLETLHAEHIKLARAKGVPEYQVVIKHGLRNALLPIVTLIGMQIGHLLGGTVIIETIFAWPGVGRLIVGAIMNSDYATAQGGLLLMACVFVMVNLTVDLLYSALDPRLS
ncbi:peptide/nickel transport system permease protein/oligopeptide transport system permease protein [Bosea sp. BE271]|nr:MULTISPECIES: ABC transporter permease [Bosea]MDR6830577.1 peptide/nickel transport system permease protein/oligopeptide transport system permease protein [Bosea robiniae]MDR6897458.1 peptide/nickel transport system permease protein/oligopeptide transport system permease protein [Bosea sp. BE109]MDR7140855.1 peptide/nickel transport system permease protein/oligopeptide transport system permease protein [Bosea sp. BE168]MDR7177402.1 peptide/nickel transport system permease protein/oligopeptid